MNRIEFKNKWIEEESNLNQIRKSNLQGLNLSINTIEFLHYSGLPEDASPFLSFNKDSEDIFESAQKLTTLYDFVEKEFEKYIVIGSCNDGDFIVINTNENDQIECLDHENNFSSEFFNTNINNLAACLLAYRNFVNMTIIENGEDAYLESNFSDEAHNQLKTNLFLADKLIESNKGFWYDQINMELELRNDSRKS